MYISSEKFISHSGNYELKYIDWKDKSTHTIVEKFKNYPNVFIINYIGKRLICWVIWL